MAAFDGERGAADARVRRRGVVRAVQQVRGRATARATREGARE
jgi:hypothetical protein